MALPSPERRWPRVGVVVVGDVTHVVIDRPLADAEFTVGHRRESFVELSFEILGRRGVVVTPHHHGHETDLAVRDPTQLVLDVTRRDHRRLAELTIAAHLTLTMIVDRYGTIVPGAGIVDTTLVQVPLADPGPLVWKKRTAFLKAANVWD